MLWPERIFHRKYPTVDRGRRKPGEPVAREPIPPAYAAELMAVITALNAMEQADVSWECGTRGIGAVVYDTLMFQRGDPSPPDRTWGLADDAWAFDALDLAVGIGDDPFA